MATLRGGRINERVKGVLIREISFSGVVMVDGLTASRIIKGYRVDQADRVYETVSGVDGTWVLKMVGGPRDEFRIICVGEAGENSVIYEHVTEE